MASTYETDFYAWTQETAEQLRSGRQLPQDELDRVIEEIEDLGRRHFDSLVSYCALYQLHRLKWDYQPALRGRSWQLSMKKAEVRIKTLLKRYPGLRRKLAEAWTFGFEDAVADAVIESGMPRNSFPATNPYSPDEVLNTDL